MFGQSRKRAGQSDTEQREKQTKHAVEGRGTSVLRVTIVCIAIDLSDHAGSSQWRDFPNRRPVNRLVHSIEEIALGLALWPAAVARQRVSTPENEETI